MNLVLSCGFEFLVDDTFCMYVFQLNCDPDVLMAGLIKIILHNSSATSMMPMADFTSDPIGDPPVGMAYLLGN